MLNKVKLASVALALSMGVFTATCANAAAPILGEMIKDGQTPSLATMLKQVLPAVVNISVKGKKDVQDDLLLSLSLKYKEELKRGY